MSKLLKEFVNLAKNKRNNQLMLTIRSKKLKECNLEIDDLLNTELNKKIKKFERG